jgi:hypothetical protein
MPPARYFRNRTVHSTTVHSPLLQCLRVCAARPTARTDSYRGIRYWIAEESAMVGPRTQAVATLASQPERWYSRQDRYISALAAPGLDQADPGIRGPRRTYVTRRWFIGPSWSGTLGTSGWLSVSALNSVPESGNTSRQGKRALQACTRPITKFRLASSYCHCGARVDATNSPDCRLDVILCGKIKIVATRVWVQTLVRANASRGQLPGVAICCASVSHAAPEHQSSGIYNDLQRMSKSCRILMFLAGPGKHRVTRGEPRPIRSPALRLAVSRVAAVDSERQSLIGDGR